MRFFDIFKIKKYKSIIRQLNKDNKQLNEEISYMEIRLNSYDVNKKLNRLFEVPRSIGTELYVITDIEIGGNNEIMFVCRSDNTAENSIKIISITITHFIINSSGIYIGFNNDYGEKAKYINIDSPNLFLNIDAAVAELLHGSNKSKYKNNPFTEFKNIIIN